jgi:outer membrane protein assembly factor BamD
MKGKILKKGIILLLIAVFYSGCGGKHPDPNWTAEEYFRYAKEKYDDEDYLDASNDFTVVILRFAGSSVADSAQYYIGCSHFFMDEYIISAAEFEKLINSMAQSPLVPDAQYMLAESYYQMSPRASLDQEYTIKALREFQAFVEEHPLHKQRTEAEKKIAELREKLACKQWLNAELYRKMREFGSSLIYYDVIINQYYDSDYAEKALFGKTLVYMAMKDFQKAREQLLIFREKFPNSELKDSAEKNLQKVNERLEQQNKK